MNEAVEGAPVVTTPGPTPAAPAPAERRPGEPFAVLGATTALHLGWGLARGTLVPTPQGVLLGPLLLTLGLLLALGVVRAARAGRRREVATFAVVSALALWPVLGGGLARVLLFPGSRTALAPGADVGGGVVVAPYVTDDGVALRGAFVRGDGPGPRPVVVFFHGNAQAAGDCLGLGRALARRGVDVLVAEYRGFGGCAGWPSEDGLLRDARAAVREAERLTGVPAREQVLVGLSLGTGVAAALASEGVGRAVVLLAPYTSITDVAARIVPPWLAAAAVRDAFDSRTRLLAATQPVTIVHGTADTVIPYALGQELARALGPRARLVTLEGRGHDDLFEDGAPYAPILAACRR